MFENKSLMICLVVLKTLMKNNTMVSCSRWSINFLITLSVMLLNACATTMTPIHPSENIEVGEATDGLHFSPDMVSFKQKGTPISAGHIWENEVATFAADQMNTLLNTDPEAQDAKTTVVFEYNQGAQHSMFGGSKELTISMQSRLPDGRLVRTDAFSQYLENGWDYWSGQMFSFAGPVLGVVAFVAVIFLLSNPNTQQSVGDVFGGNPNLAICGCIFLSTLSEVVLNLGQLSVSHLIAYREEKKASNLFVDVLKQHAVDIREAMAQDVSHDLVGGTKKHLKTQEEEVAIEETTKKVDEVIDPAESLNETQGGVLAAPQNPAQRY